MINPKAIYLFEVQASEPANGTRPYWANVRLFVVTSSAERAMELVKDQHPDCQFHQVIRRSSVSTTGNVIVDADVVGVMGGDDDLPDAG